MPNLNRLNMRLLICFGSFLFFQTLIAHSALQEIPEALKSKIVAPEINVTSWLVADFETGWVLASKNAQHRIEPASLTKLMTSYVIFDALRNKEISMEDMVDISETAWRTGGSRMFIEVGTQVSVLDLIQGLVVQSGNDAGVALAEHVAGSKQGFASRMNLMAEQLGMSNTSFTNSNGIPEADHYSTAEDMALLSISLIREFPKLYRYYSQNEFTYNNITQQNRNILLKRDPTVDGIKTGYTKNSGYSLIGSALRNGMRLVVVVSGSDDKVTRADQVQSLLQYGYGAYEGLIAYQPGDEISALRLWFGETLQASVGVQEKINLVVPKGKSAKLSAALELPASLNAPIEAGTPVGYIQVKYDQQPVYRTSLLVNESYAEGPWHKRIMDYMKQLID